jgi:DNA polymerase-3 subunit delta
MIMYIYGDDSFRSRAYLRQSIEQFRRQRDPAGYNCKELDYEDLSEEQLWAEVNVVPFLAEKRLVVVTNLLSSSDKELLASVQDRIINNKISASVIFIVWQAESLSKVKEAKELHKLLSEEKFAKKFDKLVGNKLTEWIVSEVQNLGGTIEPGAAILLGNAIGHDVWQLPFKINQLVAFKNGKPIDSPAVQEFIEEKIDDNVFAMIEALVTRDQRRCFKLLNDQRKQGEDDFKVFGLILWQFRILLGMSDLLEHEKSLTSDEIAKILKLNPFVARKNFAIVRRFTSAQLKTLYSSLLDLDRKTKTGYADQGLLLDLFIARV